MAYRLIASPGLLRRILLGTTVLGVHLFIVDQLAHTIVGWSPEVAMSPRLQVVYVREMSLAEPPLFAPAPAATKPALSEPVRRRVRPPEPVVVPALESTEPQRVADSDEEPAEVIGAASQAETAASAVLAEIPPIESTEPRPAMAQTGVDEARAEANEEAGTDGADTGPAAFVWPASTRLTYVLTGNYRGEVHGSAQVEWINAAPRYQVNLDVTVGLPFAPLFTRTMRSDGRLTIDGLQPLHYAEQSQLAFRERREIGLSMADGAVKTDDGRLLPRAPTPPSGSEPFAPRSVMQDSASQFVQLTYLFTTQPQLLTPGTRIAFALALPSGVRNWVYEVGQQEPVYTPFGAVDAIAVHPAPEIQRGRDLLASAWFAPRLGYLPVRIRIEQDAEVYLDMMIKRRPELAAP